MPIYLVTGKPGHGKTLYAVTKIEERAKAENRTVYYDGIKDLKLDWQPLPDGKDWWKPEAVPDGAIIVLDEAQRIFPPRSSGSKVPEHVQPFDTHRHRGLDIYLITQDPSLIDSFVRNLVGDHSHILRSFGAQSARIYHWDCVRDPDSRSERSNSIQTDIWFYPKKSFELYHSASEHTIKRNLPKILTTYFPAVILFAIGTVGYAWWHMQNGHGPAAQSAAGAAAPGANTAKISDEWRVSGWFGKQGEETLVLMGNDGRLRHLPKPAGLIVQGNAVAMVLDGHVVTEFSGNPDRVGSAEEKDKDKKQGWKL